MKLFSPLYNIPKMVFVAKHHFISLWTMWHANTHICAHLKCLSYFHRLLCTLHLLFIPFNWCATIHLNGKNYCTSIVGLTPIFNNNNNNNFIIHRHVYLRSKTHCVLRQRSLFIVVRFYFMDCYISRIYVCNTACLL